MTHNLYTDTIDSIAVSGDFKRELIKKLRSRAAVPQKNRATVNPLQKLRIAAFASAFVVVAVAGGVFWNINRSRILDSQTRQTTSEQQSITVSAASQSSVPSSENQIAAISSQIQSKAASSVSHAKTASSKPISKAPSTSQNQTSSRRLGCAASSKPAAQSPTPSFTFNNRVYILKGWSIPELPSNYKLVGKTTKYYDFVDGALAPVGTPIYMDPADPYGLLLEISPYKYKIYCTRETMNDLFYYNGSLYRNLNGIAGWYSLLPSGFNCVGTVQSINYTGFPSKNFESNIVGSTGFNVYASSEDSNTIYIYRESRTASGYLKLTKQ